MFKGSLCSPTPFSDYDERKMGWATLEVDLFGSRYGKVVRFRMHVDSKAGLVDRSDL